MVVSSEDRLLFKGIRLNLADEAVGEHFRSRTLCSSEDALRSKRVKRLLWPQETDDRPVAGDGIHVSIPDE